MLDHVKVTHPSYRRESAAAIAGRSTTAQWVAWVAAQGGSGEMLVRLRQCWDQPEACITLARTWEGLEELRDARDGLSRCVRGG